MNNGDMPATAQSGFCTIYGDTFVSEDSGGSGLTKRESFAMAAMQGFCANNECLPTRDEHFNAVCMDAVRMADVLLKELEK